MSTASALARRGPTFVGGRGVSLRAGGLHSGLGPRLFKATASLKFACTPTWPDIFPRPFTSSMRCHQQTPEEPTIPSLFLSSSWQSSEWAIHVAVSNDDAPIHAIDAIEKALTTHRRENGVASDRKYTAEEILRLGSAWYLPAADMNNPYKRPSRLSSDHGQLLLTKGDYLRIHHDPRRFPAVDLYDWSLSADAASKPKVLVHHDLLKGYVVVNKPPECISVHPTVDNEVENVASCLRQANPDLDYVTAPHRLDQNTSGLITLATSKAFAAYYAQGLRNKTAAQVASQSKRESNAYDSSFNDANGAEATSRKTGIHKVYRCLVCLIPPSSNEDSTSSWSVEKALSNLKSSAKERKVLRHFLEPSPRSPKRFVSVLPPNATTTNDDKQSPAGWAECLMLILSVGDVFALKGNAASDTLAESLWNCPGELMPPSCQAVVEVEVELLTGRTHQIRGQLSAEGYPLVNDLPYGGAVVDPSFLRLQSMYKSSLALQCCRLEFLDPDLKTIEKRKNGEVEVITKMVPSQRWNKYHLDSAWWTPCLEEYKEALKKTSEEEMTTASAFDIGLVDRKQQVNPKTVGRIELLPRGLPPQAMLSPGRNKYVLVKAVDPNNGEIYKWFVKSASPKECGGPYHKDVARDLVEGIKACGYRAVVTGGGRILYHDDTKRALVYGFSYGFGRGDHALAAKVIKEWSGGDLDTAYDDSPELY